MANFWVFSRAIALKSYLFLALALFASLAHANYTSIVGANDSQNIKEHWRPGAGNVGSFNANLYIASAQRGWYSNTQYRIFVPPGTVGLDVVIGLFGNPSDPNAIPAKVTARWGAAPTLAQEQVTLDSASKTPFLILRNMAENPSISYAFYAAVSSLTLSKVDFSNLTTPLDKGGWLYVKNLQLPSGMMLDLNITLIIDKACFDNWYANASWDASGNPREDVEHRCTGSTGGGGGGSGGGTFVPPTTDTLVFSPSSVKNLNDVVSISVKSGGQALTTLTSCKASGKYDTYFTHNVSPSHKLRLIKTTTEAADVTVTCGTNTGTLRLEAYAAPTPTWLSSQNVDVSLVWGSGQTAKITPTPAGTSLSCTDSSGHLLIDDTTGTVSINPGKPSPSSPKDVAISCGGASTTVKLLPGMKFDNGVATMPKAKAGTAEFNNVRWQYNNGVFEFLGAD